MIKFLKISTLLIISLLLGSCYGYFVHRNKIFPYYILNKAKMVDIYRKNMQWSIGVFEGSTPFNLTDTKEIDNPAITARDVSDVEASFVADPFSVKRNDEYFMFFEVLNMDTYTGDIGYAVSDDGKEWHYKKIILDESFHLSYPCVYELNGIYYMIPESSEDLSVKLYRASSFPDEWEYIGNLLSGAPYTDPTAFLYNDKWWMFTSNRESSTLNLFYSDSLTGGWQPHPMNPIIENNRHYARPAGRVFVFNDKLYRMAQDDYPQYGLQVFAVEVSELSTMKYKENADSLIQIVSMTNKGWNSAGMHHVDLYKVDNKWHAAVDGLKRRPRNQ